MPSIRQCILVLAEAYHPAFKAGGPIRSLVNLVDWLGEEYNFHVYTRDRDLGDTTAFAGIVPNAWQTCGLAQVWYSSPESFSAGLDAVVQAIRPEVIYLNSFFAPASRRLLWQRRLGNGYARRILLAPRGELQPGALAQKSGKKRLYLALCRAARLGAGVRFHATATSEIQDLRRQFGAGAPISLAPNLPARATVVPASTPRKEAGSVRLVYCSRVVPKKNLLFLCERLRDVRGRLELTILGPREDEAYARQIEERVVALPPNVSVRWKGVVAHDDIAGALAEHHFFVLPTLGENYGHAIVEAWQAGTPVVLSNRTPWRDLALKRIGWDLPLESPERWTEVLQSCVDLDELRYRGMATAAFSFAGALHAAPPLDDWRALFRGAIA